VNILNFTYNDVIRNFITHLTLDSHYSATVTEEVRKDTKQTIYPTEKQ